MANMRYNLGLPNTLNKSIPQLHCQGFFVGKFTKAPQKGFVERPLQGQAISADIAGPLPRTAAGNQYILKITKHYTKLKLVRILRTKVEAEDAILEVIAKLEIHSGQPPPG